MPFSCLRRLWTELGYKNGFLTWDSSVSSSPLGVGNLKSPFRTLMFHYCLNMRLRSMIGYVKFLCVDNMLRNVKNLHIVVLSLV